MTQTKTIADAGSTPAGSTILEKKMMFILTFLLVAGLEIAAANDNEKPKPKSEDALEEPDLCVGCEDTEEKEDPEPEQLTVEVRIDPLTGKVHYIIRGIVIE